MGSLDGREEVGGRQSVRNIKRGDEEQIEEQEINTNMREYISDAKEDR